MNTYCFWTTLIAVVLHLAWCYSLITKAGLGLEGTGIANLISQLVNFMLLLGFTHRSKDEGIVVSRKICFDH